jgi:hypothetical protein
VLETHGFEHITEVGERLRCAGYRFERK